MDEKLIQDFVAYWNLADELSDPTANIEDFTPKSRKSAERFAKAKCLSFPPRLAEAEDFYLNNRGDIDAFLYA